VSHTSKYYPNGIPKSSVRLVVPCTSTVQFVERTSSGPPMYVRTRDRGVRPTDLAYVCLLRLVFVFYFLRVQSVIRLTLKVLGLVKTPLLKTFVDGCMEKVLFNKKVCFYQSITLSLPYRNFILGI
jgi:hypothetical protein